MKKLTFIILVTLMLVQPVGIYASPRGTAAVSSGPPVIQPDTTRTYVGGEPLQITFVWHQHQPSYYDPTTGYYEQPWVFMHSINDYPFMAQLIKDNPTINSTMDITGTLLRQLVDYANHTAKDRLIEMVLKSNTNLTEADKSYLFGPYPDGNLFNINGKFIQESQKFQTLSNKRADYLSWSDEEMNSAKVLFFLKWMNRRFVEANTTNSHGPITLSGLLAKQNGLMDGSSAYTQADIDFVVAAGYDIVESVIPLHKELVQNGQLELVTTPFAHPIGPLLLDLNSELDTSPGKATKLPQNNTMWPEDLDEQIRRGNELFKAQFGQYPNGIWSPEQAVSPALIPHYQKYNINWSITAPEQLAKVPGRTATEADLNRLYKVDDGGSNSMFFVYDDTELSDKVGFNYASFSNQTQAVEDFMNVLYRKYTSFKDDGEIRLATLGMDGENAWEWYPDDAIPFREGLYAAIVQAQNDGWLKTTTVSKFINEHAATEAASVDHTLTTGSWINGDFTTWIGEDLENRYWDELIDARSFVVSVNATLNSTAREKAWDNIYLSEGSDWFWWAGADQDSGHDEKFDWAFKSLLRSAYYWAGKTPEQLLSERPFLFEQLKPLSSYERDPAGESPVTVDGALTSPNEWDNAGWLRDPDGGVTKAGQVPENVINDIYIGYGAPGTSVYIRMDPSSFVDIGTTWSHLFFGIYVSGQGGGSTNIRTRHGGTNTPSTGFPIAYEVGVNVTSLAGVENVTVFNATGSETWVSSGYNAVAAFGDFIEVAIPVDALGVGPESMFQLGFEVSASNVSLSAVSSVDFAPNDGPIQLTLPPAGISGDLVFSTNDPMGDETGSAGPVGSTGGLEYGTNAAFDPYKGLFDLTSFGVYHDSNKAETIFQVGLADITNPWGSPYGLSHPGILIYVDQDRVPGSGGQVGIEGSSTNIDEFSAYEWGMQAGGWEVSWSFYSPTLDENGFPTRTAASPGVNMRMVVDPNEGFVRITVADSAIGFTIDDTMGFIVATVSNDGYSPNNIRPTGKSSAGYKLGGQSDSDADPNVIDVLTPPAVDQLTMLSNYKENPPTMAKMTAVGKGIDGIYDFDAPKVLSTFFNDNSGTTVRTNSPDGAIVNASFTVNEPSGLGGIWAFENGKLIGVSSKEKSYVEFFLTEGAHSITIRLADTVGNVGEVMYNLTVIDGYGPVVTDVGVDPSPPIPDTFLSISAIITDPHIDGARAMISVNGGASTNATLSLKDAATNTWSGIIGKYSEGDQLSVLVVGFDVNRNEGVSDTFSFTVMTPTSTTDTSSSTASSTKNSPILMVPLLLTIIAIPILRKKIQR